MAENPVIIDQEQKVVRRTFTVPTDLEQTWSALATIEEMKEWFARWMSVDQYAPGGTITFSWREDNDNFIELTEYSAPSVLAFEWGVLGGRPADGNRTLVTFTLAAVDGGTEVQLVHSGFENLDETDKYLELLRGGWQEETDEFIEYAEKKSAS